MKTSTFPKTGRSQEYAVIFAGVLGNFCQSVTYFWLTPLLYYFQQPGLAISMTPVELTCLTVSCDLSNALFSPIVCYLADVVGRKPVLWSAGPICALSWLCVICLENSKTALIVMRVVQGISVVTANAVLPMYLSEVASVDIRGGVVSSMNTLWHLGMVYISVVNLFFEYIGITWFTLAPNIIYTVVFYNCPESPYFLLMKNRNQDALTSLARIRGRSITDPHITKEIAQMEETVQKDRELTSTKGAFKNIAFWRKDGKSFLIIEGITIIYMFVGCNTIALNASETIVDLSGSIDFANYVTVVVGVILLLMTIPSLILSDRWGRRPILLLSSAATFALFLIATVTLYFVESKRDASTALLTTAFLSMLFGACFNTFGIETLQQVLVGEMFPTNARSVTVGITYSFFTASSALSLSLYSYLEKSEGIYANYLVFTIFSALGFFIYWRVLPETMGKTFGEIQDSL